MIAYFKYTNGESFKLNGIDYAGFFNVENGIAYTGKKKEFNSETLTPKNNFITDFYLKKLEFDNQFDAIQDIQPYYSDSFDILNKNELDNIFERINKNNLDVFKSLIISNPYIIDLDENSCHFYGLSSTTKDGGVDDVMTGKDIVVGTDPFSYSGEWSFLENIKHGDFVVKSDQNFIYLCSTGVDLITIKGSFDNKSELTYSNLDILKSGDGVTGIYYDEFENTINITINGIVNVYDALNYIECETLVLIDKIQIGDFKTYSMFWNTVDVEYIFTDSTTTDDIFNIISFFIDGESVRTISRNIKSIRYGDNIRTFINNNILYLWNKKSLTLLEKVDLLKYGIEEYSSIDIRNVDDLIIILHKKSNNYEICVFDPFAIDTTFKNYVVDDLIENTYDVYFSTYDSNVFFIRSANNVETRFVSNPKNTSGQFKAFNLKYIPEFIWGNTKFYYKYEDNKYKWNSTELTSNYFYNLLFNEITKSNKNYMLLHNSGRLYALKQPILDNYYMAISENTEKYFTKVFCNDYSFGLFFNKNISNILKDVLTLYTKATNSYNFKKDDVTLNDIKNIEYDLNNLRVNGNESINTTTMQRIFTLIIEIQQKLIANLTIQS